MNLIWDVDSKQSEVIEAALKITFYWENCNIVIAYIMMPEAYSEPYQRYEMECFEKKLTPKKFSQNALS